MKKIILSSIVTTLFVIGVMFSAGVVYGAALDIESQPAGEVPLDDPLQPAQPGVQPNYSGNIQDGEKVNPEELLETPNMEMGVEPAYETRLNDETGEVEQVPVDSSLNEANPTTKRNYTPYLFGLAALIIIASVGAILWSKRGDADTTSMTAKIFILMFVFTASALLFSATNPTGVYAQSPPINGPQIQRTIEEVDSNSTVDITTAAPEPKNIDNSTLYTIVAAALIVVAIGAIYILWTRYPIVHTPKK